MGVLAGCDARRLARGMAISCKRQATPQRARQGGQIVRVIVSRLLRFITVLAYQAVQVIRRPLREKGMRASWTSLREILSVQRRVMVSFTRKDGRNLHVRKVTVFISD